MKLLFENWRRYQTMMERINELGYSTIKGDPEIPVI